MILEAYLDRNRKKPTNNFGNVVLFSNFLTMTTTSCRDIEKLLINHLVLPEAQR